MGIRYFVISGLLGLFILGTASGQVSFEASVDARQIVLGGYFEVNFILKNADGSNFRPPDFKDFAIFSGPSRSMSTSIINGQVSKEQSYGYTLQPKRVGVLQIGSASIMVGGKTYSTNPISVEVVKGKVPDNKENKQIFVEAQVNIKRAAIGQQILLDYKLYTTVDVETYNVLKEADYQGFYAQDIRRFESQTMREVVKGVQFATKVIKRLALFPQQTGKLVIDPMALQFGVVDESSRQNNFFFNRQLKWVNIQTEPIEIEVYPLPENAPETFSGGVGKFTISTSVSRANITTDDAMSLKMIISGDGDMKRVNPPILKLPDNFEVYDPRVLNDGVFEKDGQLMGQKEIEYLAVPKEEGIFRIAPQFTYYSTDSSKYVTIKDPVFDLSVRKGSNNGSSALSLENNNSAGEEKAKDIRYLKPVDKLWKKGSTSFNASFFLALYFLPFLIFAGFLVYQNQMVQKSKMDPAILKKKRARKIALKRLQVAQSLMKDGKSREFYDETSKAMLEYVSDKLKIPRSELSKENLKNRMESLGISESGISRFMKVLQTSEMALFAGKDNPEAMNETYQTSINVLTDIEEGIGNS